MQRDHEDRSCGRLQCNLLGRIEPIHAGHLEVEHDDVKFIPIELFYRFQSIGRFAADLPVILRFE